jgi:flavin-dependent dehydrogenase
VRPDVIVVGAGPAGSVAALVLARAGARVRLVDRSDFPRDKLCGDTLNPGALAILDRLPVGAAVRRRALTITGMNVTGPGSASVPADYPRGFTGAAIVRRDLDALLLEAALSAGAAFTARVHVRAPAFDTAGAVCGVVAADRELTAKIVIAADGRRSTLASALGLARVPASPRRWAFGGYFERVDDLTSRGEMHIRRDGYIGVAPLPGGLVNVCVVRDERCFRLKAEATSDRASAFSRKMIPVASSFSRQIIVDAIASDPRLRDRFSRARQVGPVAALGPLAVDACASGCHGLLLAGDAGGFVDPMTGDGLRFALRGGELAAAAALDELASGVPAFRELHAARAREFSGKWRLNRALRSLVASPRGVSIAASLASLWPAPVEYLVGIAGDVPVAARTAGCGAEPCGPRLREP